MAEIDVDPTQLQRGDEVLLNLDGVQVTGRVYRPYHRISDNIGVELDDGRRVVYHPMIGVSRVFEGDRGTRMRSVGQSGANVPTRIVSVLESQKG